jgi:glucose-1-phosphate adenylyltransferase
MERIILFPGHLRTSRTLSRKHSRRAPLEEPRRIEDVDVREAVTVVLGGGRGNRLFPLTQHRCKPAVPVGGTYRLVDISISNSLNSGIDRVFVLTQFNSASLNSHIANTYRSDSFARGYVEILAAEQTETSSDWYQGTADAVRKQLQRIGATGAKEVVVLSGDHLYRMDLRGFIARHRAARADVTVGVTTVARARAAQFGVLRTDEDDRVVEFAEKPTDPATIDRFVLRGETCLASMGIYVFKLEVLARMLEDPALIDFGQHVIPRAIGERPVAAHRFEGYWEDLGTIATYHRASLSIAAARDGFDLFFSPESPIYSRPRFLPATRIEDARLTSSLVPDGCIIEEGASVSHSVLGPRTLVGRNARIEESVIFGASRYESDRGPEPRIGIGRDCVVKRAIIDDDVRIGDGAILENRAGVKELAGPHIFVRDGIIVIPRGATIPPGLVF